MDVSSFIPSAMFLTVDGMIDPTIYLANSECDEHFLLSGQRRVSESCFEGYLELCVLDVENKVRLHDIYFINISSEIVKRSNPTRIIASKSSMVY
jgi:hypothetical protein